MAELFDYLPAAPVLRTLVQYLSAFCSRPLTSSDVLSGIIVRLHVLRGHDKYAKCRDPSFNRFREILLEWLGETYKGGLFDPPVWGGG